MAFRSNASNKEIFNAIRGEASNDFQRRLPDATKANLQQTLQDMWRYQPTRNEFIDAFVNQIGLILYNENDFKNPLAKFKIGLLPMGDTIEEYNVGYIQATGYDPHRDSLERDVWGQAIPEVQSSFHKRNRLSKYKITINHDMLKAAFLTDDGLAGLIGQIMAMPQKSDQLDEFLLMCQLFPEYHRAGGFFNVQVPDLMPATSTEADAKYFLRRVREYAAMLPFPSTHYNASGMLIAADLDDLELFITPQAQAAIDVEALAAAFNVEYAEIQQRTTVIPYERFGIPGAQAILTSKHFFKVADTLLETRSISNPDGLYDNHWLHHHQIIGASRFVPAILLSTAPSDVIEVIETPVTGISAVSVTTESGTEVTQVKRGDAYQVAGAAITTPTGGYNDAVQIRLSGNKSQLTYLTTTGILQVGMDEEAANLTLEIIATDANQFTNEKVVVAVGDYVVMWPNPHIVPDVDNDGLIEVTPLPVPPAPTSGANKNKVTIPEVDGVDYKDGGTTVSGTTITLTANKTITAVAQAGHELAPGATASWALVFTA